MLRSMMRLTGWLRPYWTIALAAGLSMLFGNLAQLVIPQLIRWIIDQFTAWAENPANASTSNLALGAGAILGLAILKGLFTFAQNYLGEKISQSVAYDIRNTIFGKLQNLSFSYHDRARTGQLMTRVTSDVEQVRFFLGLGILQSGTAAIMIFGSLAILLTMNWRLALATMLVLPFLAVFMVRLMTLIRPMFGELQARLGVLNTILQENLAGVRVVKAFAEEAFEAERYQKSNVELRDQMIHLLTLFSTIFPMVFLFANFGTILVIWIGGRMVIDGAISLGELVAFNTYLTLLLMPLFIIGGIAALISRAAASADRIFEVIDAENEVHDAPDAQPLPPLAGQVAFDEVSFRYAGSQDYVLEKLSFAATPGETIAILGQTGSGKSSIINLIPRFYDPVEGAVKIDGYDIRTITLDSLRKQIGIVLQESTLFTGTIRENIAYGIPDAPMEDVVAAAQAAQAHEFITELPDGYDSVVGERGIGLSGGQKQRIAIARALLVDPKILILDDSTSAVDAETEYKIQQALDKLMVGRTSFVIAQRISTVRNANKILLLDRGQLAAIGTHDELLATSSLYGEIIDSQFRDDDVLFVDAEAMLSADPAQEAA